MYGALDAYVELICVAEWFSSTTMTTWSYCGMAAPNAKDEKAELRPMRGISWERIEGECTGRAEWGLGFLSDGVKGSRSGTRRATMNGKLAGLHVYCGVEFRVRCVIERDRGHPHRGYR